MAKWLKHRFLFWKSGIVHPLKVIAVGIVVLILPAIGIVRDVVLPPESRNWYLLKYVPNWSWHWWVICILVGLVIFLEETNYRAHRTGLRLQRQKQIERVARIRTRHTQQLTDARLETLVTDKTKPEKKEVTVTDAERRIFASKEQLVRLEAQSTPKKEAHTLVCQRTRLIPTTMYSNIISEKEKGGEDDIYAVVAEFVNSPDAMGWVAPIEYLSAQITFYDSDGKYFHRINRGYWIEQSESRIILGSGDRGKLVIAVGLLGGKKFVLENDTDSYYSTAKKMPVELEGQNFRVQVCLTATILNEVTVFNLTVKPEFTLEVSNDDEAS
jgi:hypothetical protein